MRYLIIIITLSVLSVLYYKFASRFNIIDNPNQRSSHKTATIRGGGIIFVFAFLLYQFSIDFIEIYLIVGVLLISIVSFIDDIKTLSAKLRFPFQVVSVIFVVYQAGVFEEPLWVFLGVVFLGTASINLYNFMDGINGITGFCSLSILLGMYVVNLKNPVIDNDLIIYEFLALIVFGFYNFRKKALFFAGDVGSVSIGLILVYMAIVLFMNNGSPIYLLLFVVVGADALITFLYRFLIKEKLTEAHRHHIYQKLVDRTKLSHIQVSIMYALLQLVIIFLIWIILPYDVSIHYWVTGIIFFFFFIGYVSLFKMLEKKIDFF